MNSCEPLYLLDVPIGAQNFASMDEGLSFDVLGKCGSCGYNHPVVRRVPMEYEYDGGVFGDFVSGSGPILVRHEPALQLLDAFPEMEFLPTIVLRTPRAIEQPLLELKVERVVYAEEVSGKGFGFTVVCPSCRFVQADLEHGSHARDSVFRALLDDGRNFVDHEGFDDLVLRRCQIGICSIVTVEHLIVCTRNVVEFCIDKDYSNVGFVRIGHIEE